ncbi:hypothetical protein H5410_007579 [Solanum commersonii]|uniref:Uncharacterized protein n=1 Tax=Solanum commersonii TaxID=4109 RepID=A0A9J6AD31_SOLCO|nr:hypothetical protein H5410_007579 [Solanum commersonii]
MRQEQYFHPSLWQPSSQDFVYGSNDLSPQSGQGYNGYKSHSSAEISSSISQTSTHALNLLGEENYEELLYTPNKRGKNSTSIQVLGNPGYHCAQGTSCIDLWKGSIGKSIDGKQY